MMDNRFFNGKPYEWRILGQPQFDIMMELWFANTLFGGDATRILYAPNDMCFRFRMETTTRQKLIPGQTENVTPQTLDFPFCNYYNEGYESTDPQNWIHRPGIQGLFDKKYNFFMKSVPVTFKYSATIWTASVSDYQYLLSRLMWLREGYLDFSTEYEIAHANGTEPFHVYSKLKFNVSKGSWNEDEWLKRNRISSIVCDFSADTSLYQYKPTTLQGSVENITSEGIQSMSSTSEEVSPASISLIGDTGEETTISLTKQVRLEFQSAKDLKDLAGVEKYIWEHSI